jgi:hypothetical protein
MPHHALSGTSHITLQPHASLSFALKIQLGFASQEIYLRANRSYTILLACGSLRAYQGVTVVEASNG